MAPPFNVDGKSLFLDVSGPVAFNIEGRSLCQASRQVNIAGGGSHKIHEMTIRALSRLVISFGNDM